MTEETNQAISFTDVNGLEYRISDRDLNNTDVRFDLSIRIFKEVKILDKDGIEKTVKTDNSDAQSLIDNSKVLNISRKLEYHVDTVNNYFDEIENSIVISKEEFDKLLSYLQEQEVAENADSGLEEPEAPEEPEEPIEEPDPDPEPEPKKTAPEKKKTTKRTTKKTAKSAKKK